MIALLDYDSGNIRSVEKALRKVGADVRRVRSPGEFAGASGLVLPGVGAFDDCIAAIRRQELFDGIRTWIAAGRPFLGICVGYQALFQRSEEFNSCALGISVLDGKVVRFKEQPGLKIPQIGWNQIELAMPDCPLYRGIPSGSYFYFVHSYHPVPLDPSVVATWTDYGGRFASSVWRGNVFATQFHPEKSQENGLRLLRNFVELASGASAGPAREA